MVIVECSANIGVVNFCCNCCINCGVKLILGTNISICLSCVNIVWIICRYILVLLLLVILFSSYIWNWFSVLVTVVLVVV